MKTITKHIVALILCLSVTGLSAQDKVETTVKTDADKEYKIQLLEKEKERIEESEREGLKSKIKSINKKQDRGEITAAEADELKKEAAKNTALNIEYRLAVIDNKIEFLKRNSFVFNDGFSKEIRGLGINGRDYSIGINYDSKIKPPKYDRRTKNQFVFAVGFNNAIEDGQSLGDTPYELGGSGFVEIGWNWKTRLFKESNFSRIVYGFSFQWNKLNAKDDLFFVQNGNETTLEEFPVDLKKSQFRVTNLVVPVHFEFGPSRKREYKDRVRYSTHRQFKVGLGGYGGVRLASQQKLRFREDGDRVKQKIRRNFNASDFIYGLSAYVGIGSTSLYAKYDLNSLFKDQAVDQNNISLGVRFDFD